MTKVLKCPITGKIEEVSCCQKCNWLQQVKPESVECEVAWERHVTLTYNSDDPKMEEL